MRACPERRIFRFVLRMSKERNSLDLALDEKNYYVAPFSSKLGLNFEIGSTFSAHVDVRLEL